LPGDELLLECQYQTSDRPKPTFGGKAEFTRTAKNGSVFVERSSTIERYCQPPPQKKIGYDCKKSSLFKKTNKFFITKKNDAG
jgi:hypothetical protein